MTFDPQALTAEMILSIPPEQPELLFGNPEDVKGIFRALSKIWFPDISHRDDVFVHLRELYTEANKKIDKATWHMPGLLKTTGTDGKTRKIRYKKKFDFDIGTSYIGETIVAYVLNNDFADLAQTGVCAINNFSFGEDRFGRAKADQLKAGIADRLPKLKSNFHTDDSVVLVVEKSPSALRLRDVVMHFGGRLDPKHAAWIMSEMHNLAVYMELVGLTHNDISMDTVFIRPEAHTIQLVGGWWHAASVGARLAVPRRTIDVMPSSVRNAKVGDPKTDLELIRLTGREMLGDPSGNNLKALGVPDYFSNWVRLPSRKTARDDYQEWHEVLSRSFGERRFTEMKINASDLYKEN